MTTTADNQTFDVAEPEQIAAEIRRVPGEDFIRNSYGPFAYYTIRHRALVSDDGLKPVNRRILYAMLKFGVSPNTAHQKAQKIAGYCTTWHPHGDASIADAMARMGQLFSMRVPLIDVKGTVGFTSGDKPASPRYWEAKPNEAAMELMSEIKSGAVLMGRNYDGTEDEPSQLPVRFPNNIINGSEGIAVGYASKMAPHNPTEAMDAILLGIRKKDKLTAEDVLKVMPGPDFPTGGEILEIEGIKDYYETGSGKFVVRGKYEIESLPRGKAKIIFSELPFAVPAEKVKEAIKLAQQKGKLKEIAQVKDLTDRRYGLRLVIETKAGTNPKQVVAEVFKLTPAESPFSVNSTVLVDGLPTVVSMVDLILRFIEFRKLCVMNKANFRKTKIASRVIQLEALLAVLLDIDKCIAIIRKSESQESAKTELMKKFKITDDQAEYVLSMQLRKLTKADSIALENEKEQLAKELAALTEMLSDDELVLKQVAQEIRDTKKVIADERRTVISGLTAEDIKEKEIELKAAAKIEDKNLECYITRFADGKLLKTLEPYSYKVGAKRIDNGPIVEQVKMMTKDNIVVIGSDGIGRRIPLSYLVNNSPSDNKHYGVDFPVGVETAGIAKNTTVGEEQGVMMMTNHGTVKVSKTDFPNGDEFPVFNIDADAGEKIISSRWVKENGGYAVSISSDSNLLCFSADDVRASGSKAGGVRGQKLGDGQEVVHFTWLPAGALSATNATDAYKVVTKADQTIKISLLMEYSAKGRGTQGMRSHPFKKGESQVRAAFVGQSVIATIAGKSTAVNMPSISKKSTIGSELKFDIDLGINPKE